MQTIVYNEGFDFFWDSITPKQRLEWFQMDKNEKKGYMNKVLRREGYIS